MKPFLAFGAVLALCILETTILLHQTMTSVNTASTANPPCAKDSKSVADKQCEVRPIDPRMVLCNYVPGQKNFGDQIGPDVIKKLLASHFKCSNVTVGVRPANVPRDGKSCFVNLGSVLHMVKAGDTVWAAGANDKFPPHKKELSASTTPIYAVRGPKTKQYLSETSINRSLDEESSSVAFGDPGVLVPLFYPEFKQAFTESMTAAAKKIPQHPRFCLVPHYHDLPMMNNITQGLSPTTVTIISPRDDWQNVVRKLATQCDYVASSSLHGIILSDSLGIPVLWWQHSNGMTARSSGHFKYLDYFRGYVGTTRAARVESPVDDWRKITDTASYLEPIPLADREAYATALIKSFPTSLFAVYYL